MGKQIPKSQRGAIWWLVIISMLGIAFVIVALLNSKNESSISSDLGINVDEMVGQVFEGEVQHIPDYKYPTTKYFRVEMSEGDFRYLMDTLQVYHIKDTASYQGKIHPASFWLLGSDNHGTNVYAKEKYHWWPFDEETVEFAGYYNRHAEEKIVEFQKDSEGRISFLYKNGFMYVGIDMNITQP
ncbi:MAG: hypothetical protein QNK23_14320 [Crocinitomicaceae bacterium]|nr:hypothetical protein [Crocinitomicaceae bacterium]